MVKSRGINKPKRIWQPEQDALLAALYPYSTAAALARYFRCDTQHVYRRAHALQLQKSDWFKASPLASRLRRGGDIGAAHRFPKGHVPANKGVKGISYPGMEATQFKPGIVPRNYKPVGSTRICSKDGYILMKMADGMFQWKALHRIIYARMHGPIAKGCVVTFIDGDRLNHSIANLTLITRQQNALRNSIHNYGPEIAKLYQLKGAIKRQINKRKESK